MTVRSLCRGLFIRVIIPTNEESYNSSCFAVKEENYENY